MNKKRHFQVLHAIVVLSIMAILGVWFQNCGGSNNDSKAKFDSVPTPTPSPIVSPTPNTNSPTPTPTPMTPTPTPVLRSFCDGNMAASGEWSVKWGGNSASAELPNSRACSGVSSSLKINNPKNFGDSNGLTTWTAASMSRVHDGVSKRNLDVSFKIPTQSLTHFNHIGVFSVFDNDGVEFGRLGGAIFKDKLYVEFQSSTCGGAPENLFNPVDLRNSSGTLISLSANHWYRLHTQIKQSNTSKLEVKAILTDLDQGGIILASSTYTSTCIPSWYLKNTNRFLIGGAWLPPTGTSSTSFEVIFADASLVW